MMKPLYLHIGYHRTGTTYLQRTFSANRALLKSHGLLYPETGLAGDSHSPLALGISSRRNWLLRKMRNRWGFPWFSRTQTRRYTQNLFGKLREELLSSDCPMALVSSECFLELIDVPELRQKVDLQGVVPKVVVFLRRQDRWIESVYSQIVRDPELRYSKSFEEIPQHAMLDFDVELEKWVSCFGRENVHAFLYEEGQVGFENLDRLGSVLDFDFFRLSKEGLKAPSRKTNASLDECCVELLGAVNGIPELDRDSSIRPKLYEISAEFAARGKFRAWRLPKEHSTKLVRKFEKSNQRMFERLDLKRSRTWGEIPTESRPSGELRREKFAEVLRELELALGVDMVNRLRSKVEIDL